MVTDLSATGNVDWSLVDDDLQTLEVICTHTYWPMCARSLWQLTHSLIIIIIKAVTGSALLYGLHLLTSSALLYLISLQTPYKLTHYLCCCEPAAATSWNACHFQFNSFSG